MEISPWLLYLTMQADTIAKASTGSAILFGIAALISGFLVACVFSEDGSKGEKKAVCWIASLVLLFFVLSITTATFMPRTKTMLVIIGVPAAIELAKGLELDETARSSVKLLNKYLKQELGEVSDDS